MKIRVLIVEDQTVVREALRMLLSNARYDIEVVGEAGNGEQAIEAAKALQPDVIIMDLFMPGMDGLEATAAILANDAHARTLILTGDDQRGVGAAAIRAGATGFLHKSSSAEMLVSAIHALARGLSVVPRNLLANEVYGRDDALQAPGPSLTEREQVVLTCLARGLSNAAIGEELGISTATVRSHVSHLLTKLHASNRTQAVHNAVQLGIGIGQDG